MKQLILATAIGFFAAASFAGSALADKGGIPNGGNQGGNTPCTTNVGGAVPNPGAMWQSIREATGLNPAQWVLGENPDHTPNYDNVGAFIQGKCGP